MKRSGKFYLLNEKQVMESLGLKQTPGSGNQWLQKEDGQNEDFICQLKSTDKESMTIRKYDIDTLLYNASVSHKVPVFAIQFLQSDEVFLMVRPEDLMDVSKSLKGERVERNGDIDLEPYEKPKVKKKSVRTSENGRLEYKKEMEKKYSKKDVKAWI